MTAPGVLVVWCGVGACLRAYRLAEDGLVIGRDLLGETTDDRSSRQHARVQFRGNRFVITDLGSRNGTYAAGHALIDREVTITPPGVVRTGRTVSVLVADITPFEPPTTTASPTTTIEVRGDRVIGPSMRATIERLEAVVRTETSTLIVGEPGSGRSTLARAGWTGKVYDAAVGDTPAFLDVATPGAPLLVTNVEKLGSEFRDRIKELRYAGYFVVATTTAELGNIDPGLVERFESTIVVPPLRDRPDELAAIIERAARAAEPSLGIHATVSEACLLRPWPGNITELIRCVDWATHHQASRGKTSVRGEDLDNDEGLLKVSYHADCVFPGYVPPERRRNRD